MTLVTCNTSKDHKPSPSEHHDQQPSLLKTSYVLSRCVAISKDSKIHRNIHNLNLIANTILGQTCYNLDLATYYSNVDVLIV